MADRLSAYADWLVANKDKRGTPEFDKVASKADSPTSSTSRF